MLKIFFFILFIPCIVFSQDRVNSELPKITDTLSTIKIAKGWMKNDVGKWVSLNNAIPSEYNELSNSACLDFIEYSLLKISYKDEYYFCLTHKNNLGTDYWLFNYFPKAVINLTDTTINLVFQTVCNGNIYEKSDFTINLVNDIYKGFENDNSIALNNSLNINFQINYEKKYLRFYIHDKYFSLCNSDADESLEKKIF